MHNYYVSNNPIAKLDISSFGKFISHADLLQNLHSSGNFKYPFAYIYIHTIAIYKAVFHPQDGRQFYFSFNLCMCKMLKPPCVVKTVVEVF